MAIDLGTLTTGATGNAAPKSGTTSKTSTDTNTDSDFSRTLAASRASRDPQHQNAPASNGGKTASDNQTRSNTAPAGQPSHIAKHDKSAEDRSNGSTATTPAAGTKTDPADDSQKADLVRRRLSTASRLASQSEAEKNSAERLIAEASASANDARNAARTADQAATQKAGQSSLQARTAVADHDKNATSNNRDTRTNDKTHRDSNPTDDTTGPIAALIQAPLIATQTIKPGGGSQTGIADASQSHSHSAAASLRASWQQLFARLDGHGGQGSSNGDAQNQTRGDNPAQLLAALTTDGKTGRDTNSANRFSLPHGSDTSASATNSHAWTATTATGLHSTPSAQAASTAGTASTQTTLSAPLASHDWNQALGQHTLRLAGSGQQQAQIQLHPRELGQINISVTVNDHNQAQIHFAAAHAHVRDAVEAALPQLRQSLAAGGLSLGQTSVGDQNSQAAFAGHDDQSGQRGGRAPTEIAAVTETAIDDPGLSPISRRSGPVSGIDIFA